MSTRSFPQGTKACKGCGPEATDWYTYPSAPDAPVGNYCTPCYRAAQRAKRAPRVTGPGSFLPTDVVSLVGAVVADRAARRYGTA